MLEYINKIHHIPVLEQELVDALNLKKDAIIVDGTVNGGGHALTITKRLGVRGVYIGIDLDQDALNKTQERLAGALCTVHLQQSNYKDIDRVLEKLQIPTINGALYDLGMSSEQLKMSGRGFSFQNDEPLLMTFKRKEDITPQDITAKEIINTWDEEHITDILLGYGEEQFAKKIARQVIAERQKKSIETTFELVRLIESAVPEWYKHKKIHYATKTFQALRITVNNEIESLREGLIKTVHALTHKGRIAIISFQSIEDRIIKHFFISQMKKGEGTVITKKPIVPSKEEIKSNPRARSAKLRIFEK